MSRLKTVLVVVLLLLIAALIMATTPAHATLPQDAVVIFLKTAEVGHEPVADGWRKAAGPVEID